MDGRAPLHSTWGYHSIVNQLCSKIKKSLFVFLKLPWNMLPKENNEVNLRIREYTLSSNSVIKPTVWCDPTLGDVLFAVECHLPLCLADSLILLTAWCVFSGIQQPPAPTPQHPAPMVQIRCLVRIWWLSKRPVVYYAPPRTIRLSIRSDYELKTMEISMSLPPNPPSVFEFL